MAAAAAEFTVIPLRVYLDRNAKSAEILVRNEDRSPLRMQLEAMGWQQDAEGTDRYEVAEGLIFFPKVMEIGAGESRMVRVGVRSVPVSREETYRLFIEELPSPADGGKPPPGASVQVLLRIGVPVFVAPAQPERKGEIAALEVNGRRAGFTVANVGNVHLRAESVELIGTAPDGRKILAQKFPERYFLAGIARKLSYEIPVELCPQIARLEATVVGEGFDFRRTIDVDSRSCR
jgi:fimbrial chaperone protein